MFDMELTSVIAIFAGIAALIAYINQRSKRKLGTNSKVLKLKKMPGAASPEPQSSNLEEWNFPQPTPDTTKAPSSDSSATPVFATASVQAKPAFAGTTYQDLAPSIKLPIGRTPKNTGANHPRLGTRSQLKDSIVTMTVLGPCRALAPFQDRE